MDKHHHYSLVTYASSDIQHKQHSLSGNVAIIMWNNADALFAVVQKDDVCVMRRRIFAGKREQCSLTVLDGCLSRIESVSISAAHIWETIVVIAALSFVLWVYIRYAVWHIRRLVEVQFPGWAVCDSHRGGRDLNEFIDIRYKILVMDFAIFWVETM